MLVFPPAVIDLAREELARRLALPRLDLTESQRRTLRTRLENLRKQHEWGDLSDTEYRAAREGVERQLVLLPDPDKIVSFDHRRDIVISMAENIERATAAQRRSLIELLVQRVRVEGRSVAAILWTPAAASVIAGKVGSPLAAGPNPMASPG